MIIFNEISFQVTGIPPHSHSFTCTCPMRYLYDLKCRTIDVSSDWIGKMKLKILIKPTNLFRIEQCLEFE